MVKKAIQLDCNENPEPVSKEILSSVAAGAALINRYPFETQERVLNKLARHYDLPSDNIMLVRGIDECVDHMCREFPRMNYTTLWPGFDWYSNRIKISRCEETFIRLNHDLSINTDDLSRLTSNSFAILANPSNPTGTLLTQDEYKLLSCLAGKVLYDETYIDYSSLGAYKPQFDDKTIIFRSFSKSFGLAGARIGAVFATEPILTSMKQKQWYCNIGTMELSALEAALSNDAIRTRHIAKTLSERKRIKQHLRDLGIHVYDSETNFLLIHDRQSPGICEFLRAQGIVTRRTDSFGLTGYTRITVGLEEENTLMLEKIGQFCDLHERFSTLEAAQ